MVQPDRGPELGLHPGRDHLELHRPDGGEHRRLVAAQVRAQHLDDALLVELLDAAAELLVAAGVGGPDAAKCSGAKLAIGGNATGGPS